MSLLQKIATSVILTLSLCLVACATTQGNAQTDEQTIKNKDAEIASLQQALDQERAQKTATTTTVQPVSAPAKSHSDVDSAVEKLKDVLKDEIASGEISIRQFGGVLLIGASTSIEFGPESTRLKPAFEKTLVKLADIFKLLPDKIIRVEGHTATFENDNERNSWELGASRAIQTVRFLQDKCGKEPERMVAVSFGKYWPLAPNTTEQGKDKNRTVSFVLLDRDFYRLSDLQAINASENAGRDSK